VAEILEQSVEHGRFQTHFLESGGGAGTPVLFLHGSGPGVSSRANWERTLSSSLATSRRLVAPDVLGFGRTIGPLELATHGARVQQLASFIASTIPGPLDIVGNSMGGGLALALAHEYPDAVRSLVLMGTVGIPFRVGAGLEQVWGYEPSVESMRSLIELFAFNPSLVSDDLVELRYMASIEPGVQERFRASFGPPFQRHADEMALSVDDLGSIVQPVLLLHGAEDRVIPLEDTSLKLVRVLPNAQLVVFGACGHWTQIERATDFVDHLTWFFSSLDRRSRTD
jgi:2-hydroxymuconate-semialdehyde hydrolase